MPRTRLDRLNKLDTSIPVNSTPQKGLAKDAAIEALADHFSAAIVEPHLPVNNSHMKDRLKKLAGTSFLVDVETGVVYLDPVILRALKNN